MTNTTKTTAQKTKKTTRKKVRPTTESARSLSTFTLTKDNWLVIPTILLVLVCLYFFITGSYILAYLFTPSFYGVLWYPAVPSLLIALFGMGYIYKTLTGRSVGKLANVILRVLLVVFVLFLFFAVMIPGGKGYTCTGLFGVQTDCSQTNAFMLEVYFGNPFSLMLLSALAVTGNVALLVKAKQ